MSQLILTSSSLDLRHSKTFVLDRPQKAKAKGRPSTQTARNAGSLFHYSVGFGLNFFKQRMRSLGQRFFLLKSSTGFISKHIPLSKILRLKFSKIRLKVPSKAVILKLVIKVLHFSYQEILRSY